MRAFIGLPASEEIRKQWSLLLPGIKAAGARGSWVPPENLHLTLKFLGDTEESLLPAIRKAMEDSLGTLKSSVLAPEGIGFFPHERRPRVLVVRYAKTAELAAAQTDLEARLEACGFPAEHRPFETHLTLARLKFPWPPPLAHTVVEKLSRKSWPAFMLNAAVLFESTLTPAGAVYAPRETLGFQA